MRLKNILSEYYSGATEDKIIGKLKLMGYNCTDSEEEIENYIMTLPIKTKMTFNDYEELARTFKLEKNCTPGILDRMFGTKRKK